MINVVILVGRLTKDCEIQMTGGGKKLCRFTLACNKPNGCDFVPCTAWDKQAEVIANYGKKGALIGVEGRINVDKKDDRTFINVVASRIALLDKAKQPEENWEDRLPF